MASDEREYSTTERVPAVASFQNDSTETTVVPVNENDTPDGRNSPVMGVWKPPVTPEHPEGAEIRRQVSLPQATVVPFWRIYMTMSGQKRNMFLPHLIG
jgi:hypothetical protein